MFTIIENKSAWHIIIYQRCSHVLTFPIQHQIIIGQHKPRITEVFLEQFKSHWLNIGYTLIIIIILLDLLARFRPRTNKYKKKINKINCPRVILMQGGSGDEQVDHWKAELNNFGL